MNPEQVKFKYIFREDYNPVYVNGAYGGISPRNEIVANFYLERTALPNSQTYKVTKDGMMADEIKDEREPKDHLSSFVRFIENGVVMNYQTAKEIHRWLGEQIENIEKLNK